MLGESMAYFLDNREHPWLVVIVAVRADTEIDFLREGVVLVCSRQLEDAGLPQRVSATRIYEGGTRTRLAGPGGPSPISLRQYETPHWPEASMRGNTPAFMVPDIALDDPNR